MAEFKAFSPEVEVAGRAVLSIMGGLELMRQRAMRILNTAGIPELQPDAWYPQQAVLDTFKTVFEKIGPSTVQTIGRKIPDHASFPPDIDTLEKALHSLDVAYRMNHRGARNLGSFRVTMEGPRKARVLADNPYPCVMDLGLVEGMADRFRPKDAVHLRVEHAPGPCRHKGGATCTYEVAW
jgi:hypothetical protein